MWGRDFRVDDPRFTQLIYAQIDINLYMRVYIYTWKVLFYIIM